MPNDFFEETKTDEKETPEEVEKIKLGEKEYTQEELNKKIGLADIAEEYETKWNSPIKDIYKGYTQSTQKVKDLESELEQLKTKAVAAKPQEELTLEEIKERALAEAKDLGLVAVRDIDQYIKVHLEAKDLWDDIEATSGLAKEEGKPEVNPNDLLAYMRESGVKNPQDAYDLMFKNDLKKWEAKQLESIKKPGMVTETASTAGAKQPSRVQPSNENLEKLVEEAMFREQ